MKVELERNNPAARGRSVRRLIHMVLIGSILCAVSGCDAGFVKTMEENQYGVVFIALPRFLGGGLRDRVILPGQTGIIMPWETVYKVDTGKQYVSWGEAGQGESPAIDDSVETRAKDGNEVGLAMTVAYRVGVSRGHASRGNSALAGAAEEAAQGRYEGDPEKLRYIIQNVGTTTEAIRNMVAQTARADIRTHMNALMTQDFTEPEVRQKSVNQVKRALNKRFEPEGIVIEDVIYVTHRFERKLPDGQIDRTYQSQIDRTQALNQETEQEKNKVKAVIRQKEQEYNEAQARVYRVVEDAEGYKQQAVRRGEGYLNAKRNEAEQIAALGAAEVEGLKKQAAALSGPGGEALVKLAIAKELAAAQPKFVVINASKAGKLGLDLNRVDTNELLKQLGITLAAAEAGKPLGSAEK